MKKQWEVIVCLECGELGIGHDQFTRYCTNGAEHGPTQTITVVPQELVAPLWKAATDGWLELDDNGDPLDLAEELRDSSVAIFGTAIRGKDLYRIGVELGMIEEDDAINSVLYPSLAEELERCPCGCDMAMSHPDYETSHTRATHLREQNND